MFHIASPLFWNLGWMMMFFWDFSLFVLIFPRDWLQGFRSPVHRWEDWLLIEEIRVWWHPFGEGLKEVGNGTQEAHTLSLNLSLTHRKPHFPLIVSQKLWSVQALFLFSWPTTTSSEEESLFGTPLKPQAPIHLQFTFLFPLGLVGGTC